MKRGEQKTIPALQPRTKKHRHIFGAYSWKEDCISWRVVDWKNTQTFLEFIEYLLVECYPTGRIVLVMDNVSYHKSAAALAALSLFEHRLLVIWLPPYCPELNLMERYWRHLKDLACANKLHNSIEEVASLSLRSNSIFVFRNFSEALAFPLLNVQIARMANITTTIATIRISISNTPLLKCLFACASNLCAQCNAQRFALPALGRVAERRPIGKMLRRRKRLGIAPESPASGSIIKSGHGRSMSGRS